MSVQHKGDSGGVAGEQYLRDLLETLLHTQCINCYKSQNSSNVQYSIRDVLQTAVNEYHISISNKSKSKI